MKLRVLVLSRTPVGRRMSSPAIRYLNLARVLRVAMPEAEVVLASPAVDEADRLADAAIVYYEPRSAVALTRGFDVVIGMSFPIAVVLASLWRGRPLLVLDFFSQFFIEWMEAGRDLYRGLRRRLWTRAGQLYANLQLLTADYVLCANERQRDAYVGVLGALGRLTPELYDADPTLRRLIDVAPHGVRPEPTPARQSLRAGMVPGIMPGDRLILWLGGVLSWYDPVTLLRAMAELRKTHPEAKLLFLGGSYPDGSGQGQGARQSEAIAEARRLGLLGETVLFEERWLPHDAVVEYLRAAEIGVAAYFTNAETRFAHRTRLLDYIWAGVAIVCTEGDVLAEEAREKGWGVVVPERDVAAMTAALRRLLEDEPFASACRAKLSVAAQEMTWERAFEPLLRFLKLPKALEARSARRSKIAGAAVAYGLARGLEQAMRRLAERRRGV